MADEALLRLLLELDEGRGVALARLAKRLGEPGSVLLRRASALSDAVIGGQRGAGWLRLACDDAGRWTLHLTPAGREAAGHTAPPP